MKSIHIRDINPEVLAALKRLAKRHHRSLQGELRSILEREARLVSVTENAALHLHTVDTGRDGTWPREEMYGDQGR